MLTIQPWHWLAFGMILIISELFIPSFTIIWFGFGAIIVSGIVWFFPDLAISIQVFIWAVASALLTACWFLAVKPLMKDKTTAGISLEAVLGEFGLVVRAPHGNLRGVVKFTTPLLGSEEWQFISKDKVAQGDRVTVVNVSGNTLIVEMK